MKPSFRRGSILVAVILLIGLLTAMGLTATGTESVISGDGVEPTYVSGNPACDDIGFDFGFKLNKAPNGTFYLTTVDGELTGGAPDDTANYVTISNSDGTYFDWMASLGIDAVIVKGGDNANAYVYIPEDTADTHLTTPINPENNKHYDISHIEFCYDYEVDVSKTADTSYTRTFGWTIDKSVTPETWNLFTGDSGTSEYTVAVTKDSGTDSGWAVTGEITIENNTPFDATIESVTDAITGIAGPITVECGVAFPYTLATGNTLTCTYSSTLPDGTARTNTATVTTSGDVGGNMATADVTFGDPTTVVDDTINVDDTNGGTWAFSDSGSVKYQKTFACDADEGTHDNTATIRETGQSDNASVTVNCYELTVTKDIDTSFTRTWDWSILKSGDQTELTLSVGQQHLVNYQVTVDALKTDSNWAASGTITIENDTPLDADLVNILDRVSPGGILATVDCGVTFNNASPYTLASGETLECEYSIDLPSAEFGNNRANVRIANYDYDKDLVATKAGTTQFTSGDVAFDFSGATVTEIDECIDVSDDKKGDLGTVCAGEVPKTFTYSMYVGPYETCGIYTFTNVASFVTNDTETTGSDDHTVTVTVPCGGCTLTPGYWKTHSTYGPAPYDDTWALLDPNAEASPFFLSGQSYYEVLWTAPKGGNPYYILAHAYIAAELNFLNGAGTTPEVIAAFDAATDLFEDYTPAEAAKLKGPAKTAWVELAEFLDDYNNGLIGPGHCTE